MPEKPRTAEKAKKQTHTAGTSANLMRKTAPKDSRRAGIISTGLKLFLLRSTGAILYKRYTSEQEASAAAKKAKNVFMPENAEQRISKERRQAPHSRPSFSKNRGGAKIFAR